MSLFNTRQIQVLRYAGEPSNVKGRLIPVAPATITIEGTVQPVDSEEMKTSKFLQNCSEAFTIFSRTRLNPSDSGELHGDKVLINGKEFDVVSCRDWQNGLIPHFEMLVKR